MHALFGTGWTQHLVIVGLENVCAIFDLLLEVIFFLFTINVCLKDSGAEGTCCLYK